MYAKAKNASDEAMQAQEDGKRVANEAKEMLKTLMVCSNIFCWHFATCSIEFFFDKRRCVHFITNLNFYINDS